MRFICHSIDGLFSGVPHVSRPPSPGLVSLHSQKKGTNVVTGSVSFHKIHFCNLFTLKGYILVPKWCFLVPKWYLWKGTTQVVSFVPFSLIVCVPSFLSPAGRLPRKTHHLWSPPTHWQQRVWDLDSMARATVLSEDARTLTVWKFTHDRVI